VLEFDSLTPLMPVMPQGGKHLTNTNIWQEGDGHLCTRAAFGDG
jgi:hypothetical protein